MWPELELPTGLVVEDLVLQAKSLILVAVVFSMPLRDFHFELDVELLQALFSEWGLVLGS